MAKGTNAKNAVINKIAMAFGTDYIGEIDKNTGKRKHIISIEIDKKVYVWADDGGEKVQIAIALTCPKNPVETGGVSTAPVSGWDFSDNVVTASAPVSKAEITPEEQARIADMMSRLGL